jgi:hypothetical protein
VTNVATNIVTLKTATKESFSLIGHKVVNLALLSQQCNVPQAIILTNNAFQEYLETTGLKKKIDLLLATNDTSTVDVRTKVANDIKELIIEKQLPESLAEEIHEAYVALNIQQEQSLNELMEQNEKTPCVSVRPSPIGYDGKDLHSSILNIRGINRLKRAILFCWASFYSPEALEQKEERKQEDKKESKTGFAIIIQKMVDAQVAGELHTQYKMNQNEVLIKACKGLGSALSTGLIVPDKYFITKENLAIANIEIGKQTFMLERDIDTDKTTKVYLQDAYAKKQKLSNQYIGELTLLSKKFEQIFGKPQVVDFALHKEVLYILGSHEPQWYHEKLQKEIEEKKREKEVAERNRPATEEEVQKKQEEISYGIVEELDKDDLISKTLEQPHQEPHEQPQVEEQVGHEVGKEEEKGVVVEPQTSISQIQTKEPESQMQQLESEQQQQVTQPTNQEPTEEKEERGEETMTETSKEKIQEKVAAMTATVQEIQKPQEPEKTTLTELDVMEKKEEQYLSKIKEEKGEVDINDLVLSIDPDALEQEMATQTIIENEEIPVLPIQQEQPRSQVVTEEIQPTMQHAIKQEPEMHTEVVSEQQPSIQEQQARELTDIEKASGAMIIQCFKEAKGQIPKEDWGHNPDIRHLAVLAQNYVEKKIAPTTEQVQYAMSALENLKK